MNPPIDDPGYTGHTQVASRGCGPYEPSIASSASSSRFSVFSDSHSAQSSIASSISDDFPRGQEDVRDRMCTPAHLQHLSKVDHVDLRPSYADITSASSEQRQHARRNSLARNHRPPPLVRQYERKVSFVDNLVGKHESLGMPPEHRILTKQ